MGECAPVVGLRTELQPRDGLVASGPERRIIRGRLLMWVEGILCIYIHCQQQLYYTLLIILRIFDGKTTGKYSLHMFGWK